MGGWAREFIFPARLNWSYGTYSPLDQVSSTKSRIKIVQHLADLYFNVLTAGGTSATTSDVKDSIDTLIAAVYLTSNTIAPQYVAIWFSLEKLASRLEACRPALPVGSFCQ